MEQTTLQQRIEERAKKKLLNDLVEASNKEKEIEALFSGNYAKQINAYFYHHSYDSRGEIKLGNDYTRELFEKQLPKYIAMITDEILNKIDEIDYLVKHGDYEPAE